MGGKLTGIDLRADEHKEVVRLLQRYLPDTEVWAYGSRVKGTARAASDLDLVTFASAGQNEAVSRLREAFDESALPFRVDLFVWDKVPKEFRKNIEEARVVVQKKEKTGCELPEGWQETTLGDVLTLQRGFDLPRKDRKIGQVPVIASTGAVGCHNENRVYGPGVVIGRSGSIGGAQFIAEDFWPLNTTLWVKDFKGNDVRYCYYLIKSIDLSHYNVGSGVPTLNRNHIHPHPVFLPPLPEQKAIAHILGSLDDKIELNRRVNETLEAMAQALFKSWFVDFDPVIDNALAAGNPIPDELKEKACLRRSLGRQAAIRQGLDDEQKSLPDDIRRLFPSEFAYTEEMGWIPKGWIPQSIDSFIEIDPAVNLSKNTVVPFVDMKALPFNGYSVTAINKKPYAGGARFQNGDVLLARITPCLENGKTAIVDFLDSGQAGFGSTEFIVLRGKASISTPFVACLSRNAEFREHCIKSMVGSSGRQRVQKDCFSKFYLSLPEKEMLLDKFFFLTEKNFEQAHKRSKQSRLLADLRDTLLPRLLSGEICVTGAEKLEGGLCPIQ